jgi:hypothetical protein
MRLLKQILFFTGLVFLVGCSPDGTTDATEILSSNSGSSGKNKSASEKLTPVNYMTWVENKENGLKVEKTISDVTYTLQYKPLEYVALLDLKKEQVSKPELEKKMDEYNSMQYFTFQISADTQQELLKKDVKGADDYNNRINYFSFEMQKDLKLIEGTDTLNCELFHFERVYGVAPYARFVLGFAATKTTTDKTLFYDEKIFGSGKIYLTIQAKNNNQLPVVITN